jgi:pyruvate dehydrogenase E1 component alpha subunit
VPRKDLELASSVEHLVVLDEDGTLDKELDPDLDDELLLRMHRVMLEARRHDDRRLKWQRSGRIGTFAPVKGQEAAQIGAMAALKDTDWMVPSFREVAAFIWRGASLADMAVFDAGYNEGVAIPEGERTLPIAVPVASQLPHAVGIAYAGRLLGGDSVVMVFFGDGATSEGDFHEAMNFAGVFDLPVVFACQNNQWAISVPRESQTASKSIAQKAHAYGFPGIQVDGNDVLGSYVAAEEAVTRARTGEGPTLIEFCTYRLSVHTTADDPTKYRSEEEEKEWQERDPLPRFQGYLRSLGLLDDAVLEDLEREIETKIDAAWKEASAKMEQLDDQPLHIFDHLYGEMPPYLIRQRDSAAERRRS